MSKIIEFRVGKGCTTQDKEEWNKKYLELTVTMPETFTLESFNENLVRAEILIDKWLQGQKEQATTIQSTGGFDPQELMKHSWKGKKDPNHEGEYLKGSLAWGWEFRDKFSAEVINALEKGPIVIDEYVFTLSQNLVNCKKEK